MPAGVLGPVSALEEEEAERGTPHAVQRALQRGREVKGHGGFCLQRSQKKQHLSSILKHLWSFSGGERLYGEGQA